MKPILEIKEVSKKFKIYHEKQSYLSLRDSLSDIFTKKNRAEEFWALKDVSFDVYPGDSIGIIGRNGAGKSTLLKVLSKITPPTSGKIISRGRIASLLEVGTGFHPELTGRENIFLNGSILGLRKSEITKQFDAIVDFSGVEKFLDTPLKHYSSGMQLRLAFAVAAHLEPEILIIDEVLAVGDAEFQKKCMGKMGEVSKGGRTILFVSHSMNAVSTLCNKSVVLENGRSSGILDIAEGIRRYFNISDFSKSGMEKFNPDKSKKEACILEVCIRNRNGETTNVLETCEDYFVEIIWENIKGIEVNTSIELHSYMGVEVFACFDTNLDWDGRKKREVGLYKSTMKLPANMFKAGGYNLRLSLYRTVNYIELLDLQLDALNLTYIDPMDERCIARGNFTGQFENYVLLPALEWTYKKLD